MIERNERKPYWRHTKVQMLTTLLPFVLAMIVVTINFAVDLLYVALNPTIRIR